LRIWKRVYSRRPTSEQVKTRRAAMVATTTLTFDSARKAALGGLAAAPEEDIFVKVDDGSDLAGWTKWLAEHGRCEGEITTRVEVETIYQWLTRSEERPTMSTMGGTTILSRSPRTR
jgi:hypothetical protein